MKTYMANNQTVERKWYVVDAAGQTLGRLATLIADTLRGKKKPIFTPHVDCGDYVIVINAEQIKVTGKKMEDKFYYRHSGHPGGLKATPLKVLLQEHPERVVESAVRGMVPHTKLGDQIYKKLFVYVGPEHPHQAQQPVVLEVK